MFDFTFPVSIGPGIGGARVKDLANFGALGAQDGFRSKRRKSPDADDPCGLQNLIEANEKAIAGLEQGGAFFRAQLIGRDVSSALLHENKGAVVGYEVIFEKRVRVGVVF